MSTIRAGETRVRRMAERCGGLQLEKSRRVTPPYGLRDPVTGIRWGRNGQPYGLTLKGIEATLLRRDPKCAPKHTDWKPILAEAKRIVESYDTMVTLRQLFYQLVARQIIKNDLKRYKYLSHKTAEARRDGDFPDLIDQTSEILVARYFSSPDAAKDHLRRIYRRDRTEGQEVTIYLAVEKAGIQNQLWNWFGDLGLPILALGGYGSQSYKDRIKRDVADHVYLNGERVTDLGALLTNEARPAVLIYAGDHDASGDDIFRDLVQRTDPTARISKDYTSATRTRLWKAVHRIALTKDQAADLPQNPGKDDDTRNEAFMERYDYDTNIQVELDALSPDVLRGLYQGVIDQYWDADAYDAVVEREREERQELWPEDDDEDEDGDDE